MFYHGSNHREAIFGCIRSMSITTGIAEVFIAWLYVYMHTTFGILMIALKTYTRKYEIDQNQSDVRMFVLKRLWLIGSIREIICAERVETSYLV